MAAYVPGIDVSHHQHTIDWQQVAAAGQRYAFMKVTEGSTFRDPRFATNWTGAKDAGLLASAYHWVSPGVPAADQVANLLRTLGDRPPDLPLALDVEQFGGSTPAEMTALVLDMVDRLLAAGHRHPIIYTGAGVWNPNMAPSERWAGMDLWAAHYTAKPRPFLPRHWQTWRFWQFSSKGRIAGITTDVDLNRFAGTEVELLDYAGVTQVVAVTPRLTMSVVAPVNIRRGPSGNYDRVGTFEAADLGQSLPVRNVDGADAWVRIGVDRWAACTVPSGRKCRIEVAADGRVRARVLTAALNVRTGPGADQTDVGDLKRDEVVEVLDVDGTDAWVEWEAGKWTAVRLGDDRYLAVATGAPEARALAVPRPRPRRKRPRSDDG